MLHAPTTRLTSSSRERELPDQITGYWVRDPSELKRQPNYEPTGAILLDPHAKPGGKLEALTLMYLEGKWRPLSLAAALTYIHTTALADRQPYYFVYFAKDGRHVYRAEPKLGELAHARVRARFGAEAAARARDDRSTILVKLAAANGVRPNGR
ncbi:MAG: hypothetical protein HS104_11605 [Polyangiaceae bacterium]|nr:hypothetical protein [Polyangiaceae bacterium]MCL4748576.1 hypothetical protein [Myxococcales bacterium]